MNGWRTLNADIVHNVQAAASSNAVLVVGMAGNPVVRRARKALEAAGIAFHYLEYGSYFSEWRRRNALKMWTGWPTFPMVFVKGNLVGGGKEIEAPDRERRAEANPRRMSSRLLRSLAAAAATAAGLALVAAPAAAADAPPGALTECHIAGFRNGVLCGKVKRPLDPEHAERGSVEIHYVVVPALARRKLPDPVFFLAGGPGQSAISLAPQVMALFSRLNNRRDIVFVDQRGTGRSASLACKDPEDETLAEQAEPERQQRLITQCKAALLKQPYLRRKATSASSRRRSPSRTSTRCGASSAPSAST